jgi:ABC-type branched-subunit amino acid transport system substrate-binding protein
VASRARVKAGICQYRLKNDASAIAFFDRVEGQYLRAHDKIKTAGLALILLTKTGADQERKAYYYALLVDGYQGMSDETIQKNYQEEAVSRATALQELERWSKEPAVPEKIDPRFKEYSGEVSGPYSNYKLGMAYFQAGKNNEAKTYLGRLVADFPESPLAAEGKSTLDEIGYKPKETKKGAKIGVILPMSGKYQSFGTATQNGMECAAGTRPGCAGSGQIQLIIRDDRGEAKAAVEAVEDLVKNEKVLAIVGPLSSASAEAAAAKAQELGVVMISLAQKEGIPEVGSEIFRYSLTPEQQVRSLLYFTTKYRGLKTFGVLHPNSNYGKVFLDKMKSLAPSYDATVAAAAAYNDSKNVAADIRNLKFNVAKSTPEAPIGFNALFIPDSYLSILNILPQLKAAGLDTLLLLGTNAWNDPVLSAKSGGALDNTLFLDIYFKNSKSGLVKNFAQEYQTAFGQSPSTLEAMGFDIIRFIGETLKKNKVNDKSDLHPALVKTKDFQGVTGLHTFGPDREARIKPYMLTIKGTQIEEVEK